MLGHPAFVAGLDGGDAEGVAFFSEEGVAAVAGAEGPDFAGFGKVADVFVLRVAGPGDVGGGVFEGAPTEWRPRTNSPVGPRTSRTLVPMRVMMCMETTT